MINLAILLLAASSTFAQYDTYEDSEEDDDQEEEQPKTDYTKYFDGLGGSSAHGPPTQGVDSSAGFVQPLDFTGFFAGGHFGLDGLAGGASQQVFQTPAGVSVALPLAGSGFPIHNQQPPSNGSGFVTNNINFKSLFDTSSSPSENGFRPHDFLPKLQQSQTAPHKTFFSPGFASLQQDVDREVRYQTKQEAAIEQSGAASRRNPNLEDEEEEEEYTNSNDPSEYEFDEPPILDPNNRSPQKYIKQPYQDDEERLYSNSNKKQIPYKTPYSRVSQIHHPPSESRPVGLKNSKPLPSQSNLDEEYTPLTNYDNRGYNAKSPLLKTTAPPLRKTGPHYPNNAGQKQGNNRFPHHSRQYPSPYSSSQSQAVSHPGPYKSPQTQYLTSTQSRNLYPNKVPSDFRPSPRDPYLGSADSTDRDKRPVEARSQKLNRKEIYSLPQTEFPTIIREKTNHQAASISDKNKSCKKIHRKMNPDDFSRFKRQQMTCYICTNKDKGNTYEECSYESDPKSKSFYKGSAEAYSSDTIVTPKSFRTRERRSLSNSFEKRLNHNFTPHKTFIRRSRQLNQNNDPDEQGHGPENYRFGPEYFQDDRGPAKRIVRRNDYDDEDDYEDDKSEEEINIEKEYEPPGAAENDDCERVNKDGLICMVCNNKKTGGSYEQCSYASDPDANKYEYARQSTYGSQKRPRNYRYKRYTNKMDRSKLSGRNKETETKRHYPRNQLETERKRDVDFKSGKLKRKKVNKSDYTKRPFAYSGSERKSAKPSKEKEIPGVVGLDPFFYGSSGKPYNPDDYDEKGRKLNRKEKGDPDDDETAATEVEDDAEEYVPTYEEAFFRLFPELEGTDPYTGESLKGNKDEVEENDDYKHPEIPYENDEEESESKQNHSRVKPTFEYGVEMPNYYFEDDETKKDLEKTLDQFTQKNRSECKKVSRDKMTCYQCLDKNGMQHEECMFVAASEPESKHLAYHEIKEFRVVPKENNGNSSGLGSHKNETEMEQNENYSKDRQNSEQSLKRKKNKEIKEKLIEDKKLINNNRKKLKKVREKYKKKADSNNQSKTPLLAVTDNEGQAALIYDILKIHPKDIETHSLDSTDIISPSSPLQRKKRKPQDTSVENKRYKTNPRRYDDEKKEEDHVEEEEAEESDNKEDTGNTRPNYNSVPPDPEGFDEREGPEGAYSHETEPVYDKVLKITLPKYMLSRSEHEEIFDEVLRSG